MSKEMPDRCVITRSLLLRSPSPPHFAKVLMADWCKWNVSTVRVRHSFNDAVSPDGLASWPRVANSDARGICSYPLVGAATHLIIRPRHPVNLQLSRLGD